MDFDTRTGVKLVLPQQRGPHYGGGWHAPKAGRFVTTLSPGTGETLGEVAECSAEDVDAAVLSHGPPSRPGATLRLSTGPGCCAASPAPSNPASAARNAWASC